MEDKLDKSEIFSKKVKAGKRTYFFDIKPTRSGEYFITITESKKRTDGDGFVYEKHKLFIYKEDIQKFSKALTETVDHLKNDLMPDYDFEQENDFANEFEKDTDYRY